MISISFIAATCVRINLELFGCYKEKRFLESEHKEDALTARICQCAAAYLAVKPMVHLMEVRHLHVAFHLIPLFPVLTRLVVKIAIKGQAPELLMGAARWIDEHSGHLAMLAAMLSSVGMLIMGISIFHVAVPLFFEALYLLWQAYRKIMALEYFQNIENKKNAQLLLNWNQERKDNNDEILRNEKLEKPFNQKIPLNMLRASWRIILESGDGLKDLGNLPMKFEKLLLFGKEEFQRKANLNSEGQFGALRMLTVNVRVVREKRQKVVLQHIYCLLKLLQQRGEPLNFECINRLTKSFEELKVEALDEIYLDLSEDAWKLDHQK